MAIKKFIDPVFIYKNRRKILPFVKDKIDAARSDIERFAALRGFPLTESDRRLPSLKDRHKGERCFIIGNGPSLRAEDLDKLHNEISFASNKIYLAFDRTDWRPTYYTVIDVLVAQHNREGIERLRLTKIFNSGLKKYFPGSKDVTWIRSIPSPKRGGRSGFAFSEDLIRGTYPGWTVLYEQMQVAFYMGIREMYLIGVDFSFHEPERTGEFCEQGEVVISKEGSDHFHPEYRKPGETWTIPRLDMQRNAFLCAREKLKENGGAIYNASRRTELDVFPRIDLDKLFPAG